MPTENAATYEELNASIDEAYLRLAAYIGATTHEGHQQPRNSLGRRIDMTLPVGLTQGGFKSYNSFISSKRPDKMFFYLPKTYTNKTAPKPLDPTVYITTLPEDRITSALKYAGKWQLN
eukprot:GHVN01033985.1.p2 GENE.GHVN01033985.1~~GHVN01033985.1.p2  ORF type:complete len:119 (-),score=8.10 GHVN01033985.1:397-753(-)